MSAPPPVVGAMPRAGVPPGLAGAGVLFWGWQAGLVPLAVPVAVLLESARFVPWRWDLSAADTRRVADLCRLVLVGMALYLAGVRGAAPTVLGLIQWFPLAVLPLAVCHAYGATPAVDSRTLFLVLRRRRVGADPPADVPALYLVLCVAGASAANARTGGFYVGLCALAGWALWRVRAGAVPWPAWAALLLATAGLGYAGHVGLHRLQGLVEAAMTDWVVEYVGRDRDPFRSRTALGAVGRLKLSDRIVLRVESAGPLLLHEASYDVYTASVWGATDAAFETLPPAVDRQTWTLHPAIAPTARVTVAAYTRRGRGMVWLPAGTVRVENLLALQMKRNRLGAVKIEDTLGLVTYTARAAPGQSLGGPPTAADSKLPRQEAPLLLRLARELALAGRPPAEAVAVVGEFFREKFRYTSYLEAAAGGATALEDFLLRTRAGHCEYFGTATALLLRAAGIPARYAVGYAVQEWSPREGRYLVRARHAHAWAQAWVDGGWRDVDTTPPAWASVEAAAAARWEPLLDLVSWAFFAFSRWRWSDQETPYLGYAAGWLLVPLVGLLGWRLLVRRRIARGQDPAPPVAAPTAGAGADSDFCLVEARLSGLGQRRPPSEPVARWLARVRMAPPGALGAERLAELEALVRLHYRYRFDPDGLGPAEREQLRAGVRGWLERLGPA